MSSVAAVFASIMLFLQSIFSFGGGASAPPQTAAAANALGTTMTASSLSFSAPADAASSSTTSATPSSPVTIIQQPVIERVVERFHGKPVSDTVSSATLATILAHLRGEIFSRIESIPMQSGGGAANSDYLNTFGLSQRIDQLTNTSINTPTISSPSISGGTISGTTVSGYLPLSGGTISGALTGTNLTLSGNLTVSGAQTLSGAITIPYVIATSTSVDSTFVRLTATNATTTNATTTSLAISSIPWGLLSTNGSGTVVATSTPTAAVFIATSTTATSTFSLFAAKQIDMVLYASQFSGSDAGAKINACLAALPAAGGTCDARGITGAQTAASTIVIPAGKTLFLGATSITLSGNPGVAYNSQSVLKGLNKQVTYLISGVANSSIIAPQSTTTRSYSATVRDVYLQATNATGMIGLNATNHSLGHFENIIAEGTSAGAGTDVGISITAQGGGAYYNEFYAISTTQNQIGYDFDNGANENKVFGSRSNIDGTGVRFGQTAVSDHNVMFGPAIEASTVSGVNFGVYSAGNHVASPRLELGSASVPYAINNSTFLDNVISDPYLALGASPTDPNNRLTFTPLTGANVRTQTTQVFLGSVGIGTTSPSSALDVSAATARVWNPSTGLWTGTLAPTALTVTNSQTGGYDPVFTGRMMTTAGASKIAFAIGALGVSNWTDGNLATQIADIYFINRDTSGNLQERMRITSGGSVGIGTTTPYSKLTAWGTGSLFEAVTNASSTVFSIGQNGATSTSFFATTASSTNLFSQTASLGTLSLPKLVSSLLATDSTGAVIATTSIGVNYLSGILPIANGGTATGTQVTNGVNFFDGTRITSGTALTFVSSVFTSPLLALSQTSGTSTIASGQGFTIGGSQFVLQQGSGKVGIGTTTPQGNLHVAVAFSGVTPHTNANLGVFESNSSNGLSVLVPDVSTSYYVLGSPSSNRGAWFSYTQSSATAQLGTLNSGGITQLINEGNALVTLKSGNVGIGTTSPASTLDVSAANARAWNPATGLWSGTLTPTAMTVTNAYAGGYDPVFTGRMMTSAGASKIAFAIGALGASSWADGNLATQIADIYFINRDTSGNLQERMRITSGGNVGIGTTTPTAQLSTTGTVRFSNFGAGTLTTDASGNVSVSSDERLKNIDAPFARGLADIVKLSPISYHWNATSGLDMDTQYAGFSAQNVQDAIPEAVGSMAAPCHTSSSADEPRDPGSDPSVVRPCDSAPRYLTLQDRPLIAAIVNAIKEISSITGTFKSNLVAWLGDASNGIGDLFAKDIYATNVTADMGTFRQRICIGSTCVTENQIKAMLASAGQAATNEASNENNNENSIASAVVATTTPSVPMIQISGANPATIHVGDTYADLGAQIIGPQESLDLGIHTFLDDILVQQIQLDTSTSSTHTINYVVTDTFGQTATATRTVIVERYIPRGVRTRTHGVPFSEGAGT